MYGLNKESTFVLLIGEGIYPNWPQMNIPNVHVNLEELASLLSDPEYFGIPAEKIKIVKDADVEDTSSAIYEFFDTIQTTNATVILYYSGHGLQSTKAMDDLFLATKNIRENKFEPSAIKISELRKLFSDCIAARKILLLDCCYAGKITKGFLSDDTSETVSKLNEFEGTYIMASASEFERARFDPNDPNSPTKFTGKFVEIIKNGVESDDEYFTLNSIYNQIRTSFLTQKDAPKPVQVEQNNIANFPLFKNKKFIERTPADEREWKEVIKRNNAIAYYKFKEQFPNSEFVKEADKKIDEIEDEDAWQKAKIRDTIGGYNFYLENYRSGVHIQDAKQCLARLTIIAQTDDDEAKFWTQAIAANTISLFKNYIEKYPKGKYNEEALLRINAFEEIEREERFWNEISARNQILSYQEYLKIYPNGKFCNEAKNRIDLLQQKAKQLQDDEKKNKINKPSKKLKIALIAGVSFLLLIVIVKQIVKSARSTISQTNTNSNFNDTTRLTDPSTLFGDTAQNASAETSLDNEASATDDYNYYWNLGNTEYNKQNYQEALNDYNTAINLNDKQSGLYFNRGITYAGMGNYSRALIDFTSAIFLNKDYSNAYNEMGNAYYNLKEMDKACEYYKKAADLNNENGKTNYAQYCSNSSTSTSAISIDKITINIKYDVVNNQQTGMNIFPEFTINNATGKNGIISAYFFKRDRTTPLKDFDKSYYTTSGDVSTWKDISPSYAVTTYNTGDDNFPLFIPYDQLDLPHVSGKQYLLSLYVAVFIEGKQIKSSEWLDFYITY